MRSSPPDHEAEDLHPLAQELQLTLLAQSADKKRLNALEKEARASANPAVFFGEIAQLKKQIKRQDKALRRIEKLSSNDQDNELPRNSSAHK